MSEIEKKVMIAVPEDEYKRLLEDQAFLERLRAAGVDNWEGYSDAFEDDES